jgi:hypothetical protein
MIGGLFPDEILTIAAITILCIGPAILSAHLARSSGRSVFGWVIAAVLLGPVSLLILYLLVRNTPRRA